MSNINRSNDLLSGKGILEILGLSNLPREKQQELTDKITEVILKRIFLETCNRLDDDDMEEYSKLIESGGPPQRLEEFLYSKIPDYDKMAKEVIENFRMEMIEGTNKVFA